MNRRESLRILAAGVGATLLRPTRWAHAAENGPTPRRPNILYLFTDQQFAGAMSCAGNADLKTPAVDSLAATGARFARAYCTNPLCSPSRASMLTGLMGHENGVTGNGQSIDEALRQRELGWVFRNAGYECVYGGKWHLPTHDRVDDGHGFDFLCPLDDATLAARCTEFFQRPHDRPFLLVASFLNPHDCCGLARQEDPASARGIRPPDAGAGFCPALPPNHEIPENEPDVVRQRRAKDGFLAGKDETWWRRYRWGYYRLVESVDAQIGQVLEGLRKAGLEGNTLVVFSSDHGDMLGAHRAALKRYLYEESVRIPLLVSFPGRTKAGHVVERPIVPNGLDLLPTLCDYAGIASPAGLRGRSLRGLAEGGPPAAWRDQVVVQNVQPAGRLLVTERHKYLVFAGGDRREQLVDLQNDPGEMINLAGRADCRAVLSEHRRRLRDECAATGDAFEVPA